MTPEEIHRAITDTGAVAVGFAEAGPVDPDVAAQFSRWLSGGMHAGMEWLVRHEELRKDPRNLLPGTQTVICAAYPYFQPRRRAPGLPQISMYAYGKDYHEVIRKRLRPVCRRMEEATGCATRICVDSAPIPERYWALRAGIGLLGDNGTVIIDGYGSFVFLCEILTTLRLPPDPPSRHRCSHCGRCRDACPGHAILPDATLCSTRCMSYLTIEHDDELPQTTARSLYGCDICQTVCPHNSVADPTLILPEFLPSHPSVLTLTARQAREMTGPEWDTFTAGTAMRRSRRLMPRNARHLPPDDLSPHGDIIPIPHRE